MVLIAIIVTLLGLACGLLSALYLFLAHILPFWLELTLAAVFLLIVSFVLDVLDGALARIEGPTVFGGILDMFCDRTVEIFIIIAVVSTDPENLIWAGMFSLGAMVLCITMFLIVGALKIDELDESEKIIYYRIGLMERSETFLFFVFIVAFFFLRLVLLWIFAILVLITAILRLRDAYKLFYDKKD